MAMTFRELVDKIAAEAGVSPARMLRRIWVECGENISPGSLYAAYRGTAVLVATAKKLMLWVREFYPREPLDYDSLISAPAAKRLRVDWGERARDSIDAALRAFSLPTDGSIWVSWGSEWQVSSTEGRGDGAIASFGFVGRGATLGEALQQLVSLRARAPANDNAERRGEHGT